MDPPAPTARGWIVSGRVQGVGFRWFVRRQAVSLGLEGTVRNLPDGRVEVMARGGEAGLERLEMALRQGPPGARVAGLQSRVAQLPAGLTGFLILHTP